MHGKQHRGRVYSPLFNFLLSKIGQCWDAMFSESVKSLDQAETKDFPVTCRYLMV
jgi:hypothetical protein